MWPFLILFALHRYKETFNRDGSTGPLGWPLARSLLRSCRFFACSAHSAACSSQRALLPRSTVLICSLARSLADNGSIWCHSIRLSCYPPPSTMIAECFRRKWSKYDGNFTLQCSRCTPIRPSIGCFLKRFSINVKKKCKKKWRSSQKNARENEDDRRKMTIWHKYNFNVVFLFAWNNFQIMIFLADMAFWMSNFDDFNNPQISWKLAQR